MNILIVADKPDMSALWANHLCRNGACVRVVATGDEAALRLDRELFDVLLLDTGLTDQNAIDVADYARFRSPDCKVICLTSRTFFSGGDLFDLIPNACAVMPPHSRPEDLAALIDYHAGP